MCVIRVENSFACNPNGMTTTATRKVNIKISCLNFTLFYLLISLCTLCSSYQLFLWVELKIVFIGWASTIKKREMNVKMRKFFVHASLFLWFNNSFACELLYRILQVFNNKVVTLELRMMVSREGAISWYQRSMLREMIKLWKIGCRMARK